MSNVCCYKISAVDITLDGIKGVLTPVDIILDYIKGILTPLWTFNEMFFLFQIYCFLFLHLVVLFVFFLIFF